MKKILSIAFFVFIIFLIKTTSAQNYGLSFTNQNAYAQVPFDPTLELTGSLTLEAWIYPTAWKTNVYEGCILNKEGLNFQGYMLRCGANGTLNFNIGTGTTWKELSSASGTLVLNTWQHVAGVYDGTVLKIYVNGTQVGSTTAYTGAVATNTAIPLEIGRSNYYPSRNYLGRIDEVRIWNAAVSACDIYAYYKSTISATHPNYSNLVAYYEMDNNNTDTDTDGNFDLVASVGPSGEVFTAPFILTNNSLFIGSAPAGVTSIDAYQSTTAPASLGGTNQHILKIAIDAFADVSLSQLVFQTNGTTDLNDILNARVWYTGSNPNFSPTTQFGTAIPTPPSAYTNMTFTGSQTVPCGRSYLWLTYDINPNATLTNLVDAAFVNATIDGATLTPLNTDPIGSREIAATCSHTLQISAQYGGGWYGGLVTVNVNGSPVLTGIGSTFTTGYGPLPFTFDAGTGDVITIVRTADGTSSSYMRVAVLDGNGTTILASINPTTTGVTTTGYCGGVVYTTAASLVTAYSAQLNGNFANCIPIETGFRYKKTSETIWNFVQDSNNPMAYDLQGLIPATNYHYQAYAIVGVDTLWGTTINFATSCVPVTIPFIEEFNNTSFPLCWSQTYSGALTSNRWSVSTGIQAGGSPNQMQCSFQNAIGISRLISPAIDFGQVTNPTLIFKHMFDDYGVGATLKIQTSSDLTTWTDQPFTLASASNSNIGPATVTVSLTIPAGINYIAWVVDGNHYQIDNWYIDNVAISSLTCIEPTNLLVSNILTNDVTLNWNRGDLETSWEVAYKTSSESTWTTEIASDTTYLLQNLLSSTTYNVKVRAVCAPGDESFWTSIITFNTLCEPLSNLPIIENSESTPLNELPLCFSKLVSGNAYVKVENNSGNKVVCLNPGAVTNNCYLVFPALTEPVNNIRVQFKYIGGNNHIFKIGYLTDPNDASSFEMIYNPSISGSGTWKTFDIITSNTMTGNEKIAIGLVMPSGSYVYLDSITISIQPQCVEPSALTVVNSNLNDITVSWLTLAPTSNLEYKESTSSTWTTLSGVTSPYTVGSLTQNTAYDFRVQSVCDGGVLSAFTSNLTFSTLCDLITSLPYVQDFESTAVDQIPTCYNKIVSNSASVKVVNSDGSNVLNFDAGSTSNNCFIVLPKVDLPLNTLRIMFKYYGGSNHIFKVGYVTNPSDPSSFIEISSQSLSTSGTWKFVDLITNNTMTGNERIALRFYMGYGFSARIDSLTIMNMPSCVSPFGLTSSNVTPFEATLNWNQPTISPAVDYNIEYKTTTQTTWTLISNVTFPYNLTTLLPMTTYQFRVQANCSASDISDFSSIASFTTLCAPLTPPTVSEPFAAMLPNACWERKSGALPSTGNATLSNITSGWYIRTSLGQNTAAVNQYATSQYWLITPSIDLGDGSVQYQMDFDLAITDYNNANVGNTAQSPNARFVVLISTDNGTTWNSTGIIKEWNNTTETPFSSLSNSLQSQTIPLYDSVALVPYSGIVKFAFFVYENDASYAYDNDLHIDNFQVNPYNSCVRPSSFTSTAITSTSVNLQWVENGTSTNWNIEYGPVGFALGTGTLVSNISTNPDTLQGLTPNTTYQIYVQSDCGGGSTSNFSLPIIITTGLIPVTLPYNNDFENLSTYSDFGFLNGTQVNKFVIGSASGTNNTVGGSNALYISNDNGTSWTYTAGTAGNSKVYAYLDIDVPVGVNEILLDFDWIAQGASAQYDFLRVYMMPVNIPVTAGNIPPNVNSVNYDLTAMIGNYTGGTGQHWLSQQTTWQHKQFNINSTQFPNLGGNTWRLYFHWRNDQTTAVQPPATVDNLSIVVSNCASPSNLTSTNITSSSVELSWTENGTPPATTWNIEYGPTGFILGTGTLVAATSNPFVVTPLTPATTYDFYVQANCGVGNLSGWTNKVTTTTACVPVILPINEGFESSLSIPTCWTSTYTLNNYNVTTSGSSPTCSPNGGLNMLRFNSFNTVAGNNAVLYSPLMNVSGDSILVSYYQYRDPGYSTTQYANEGIEVFYNTTSSIVGATSLGFTSRYYATAGWYHITYTIPSGLVGNAYVLFKATSEFGNNQFIDDISISYFTVSCTPPTNFAVSLITPTTATATWTAGGTETSWEVAYKPTASSTWTTAIVNTTPTYPLASLTAVTGYDVIVRAICAPGDTSAYTAIVNFTTSTVAACNAPTGLAVSNIGLGTATFNWINGGTETSWEVDYKLASSSTWTTIIATSHPYVLMALSPCSDYNVRVRAICSAGVFSNYTAVVNFTTPTPAPTNVQVTNITDQGALATWTAGGTETSWQVEYKLVSSVNWTTATVSVPQHPLTGLQSNSLYEVRVKALCTPYESVFTTPVQFTTIGLTYTITATAVGNGTITPSGIITVNQGANQTFTFTPNTENFIQLITVDGTPIVGTPSTHTFSNVIANHTIQVEFSVGINENELAQLVELFPNPTTSIIELRLKADDLQVTECKVFDMYGKLMRVIPIHAETTSIDVTDFASGVYFVRMDSERGTISKKFVKK